MSLVHWLLTVPRNPNKYLASDHQRSSINTLSTCSVCNVFNHFIMICRAICNYKRLLEARAASRCMRLHAPLDVTIRWHVVVPTILLIAADAIFLPIGQQADLFSNDGDV
jgi:hypothetical protein